MLRFEHTRGVCNYLHTPRIYSFYCYYQFLLFITLNLDVNECSTTPCTCSLKTPSCRATCNNNIGSFTCSCSSGFKLLGGKICEGGYKSFCFSEMRVLEQIYYVTASLFFFILWLSLKSWASDLLRRLACKINFTVSISVNFLFRYKWMQFINFKSMSTYMLKQTGWIYVCLLGWLWVGSWWTYLQR